MSPTSQTAIVTGGGYGIGRATSIFLARDGWRVVIVDRHLKHAEETVATIEDAGGAAVALLGDVTDPKSASRAVEVAQSRFGPVGGLVTCAAMRHAGAITEIDAPQWDETIKVILYGVFHFCKAVIPGMIERGGGAIVNVSSPDAYGRKNMVAYAAAKAAVNALTTCLAADHVHQHIRVNAVLPGFTVSGMTEHYPAERLVEIGSQGVAGRPGLPEDTAGIIRFLMSKNGETFTGGVFGGKYLPTR